MLEPHALRGRHAELRLPATSQKGCFDCAERVAGAEALELRGSGTGSLHRSRSAQVTVVKWSRTAVGIQGGPSGEAAGAKNAQLCCGSAARRRPSEGTSAAAISEGKPT